MGSTGGQDTSKCTSFIPTILSRKAIGSFQPSNLSDDLGFAVLEKSHTDFENVQVGRSGGGDGGFGGRDCHTREPDG